jgi:hypothetical protein
MRSIKLIYLWKNHFPRFVNKCRIALFLVLFSCVNKPLQEPFYGKQHPSSDGQAMMRCESSHVQDFASESVALLSYDMKFAAGQLFEIERQAILQPLTTKQNAKTTQHLFQKRTIEDSRSSCKIFLFSFKFGFPKCKQSLAKCSEIANQVRLEKLLASIVCAQCPMFDERGGL